MEQQLWQQQLWQQQEVVAVRRRRWWSSSNSGSSISSSSNSVLAAEERHRTLSCATRQIFLSTSGKDSCSACQPTTDRQRTRSQDRDMRPTKGSSLSHQATPTPHSTTI